MAIATELTIDVAASDLAMAQAIFGDGIQVLTASYQGDPMSKGIYTGAQTTMPGIAPSDSGVILSTGHVTDMTNSSGTTDTNTAAGTSRDTTGVDDDLQLNTIAGRATFDGSILNATFVPDGDFLTMQFVFTSEEYPEYVGSNFNDAFGVWVNGNFVPLTISSSGEVAINTVNGGLNQNLYIDNTADQFNTEMDGFTRILTFKAPVNIGQVNSIRIGIADAGDNAYDSNLLISGNSIQTVALAFDDRVQLLANSSRTFDVLGNDTDQTDGGLTITHLNGTAVTAGQSVTLTTGEQVRLNADGTITVFSDGDLGSNTLNYTVLDSAGNSDVGFITINTVAGVTRDGIVQGTAGADVIAVGYVGDPDGDLVDNNDALGVGGTTGDGDYILAGAGDDSITAGAGNDVVYGGADNDSVSGGEGNDWVGLGSGNDSFGMSGTEAGDETVFGDAGDDTINGGAGADRLYGGTGNDTLQGGSGSDQLYGDDGADLFSIRDDHEADAIFGGSGGTDADTLGFSSSATTQGIAVTFTGAEAGTYAFAATPSGLAQGTGSFADIEAITLTDYADTVNGAASSGAMTLTGNGGADVLSGGSEADTIFGGTGADTLSGNDGADSLSGGDAADSLSGGSGNDTLSGGDGADTLQGGEGADVLIGGIGLDLADYTGSGAAVAVDLHAGTASGGDAAGDTVQGSVDGVIGSGFDDTLTGADGENLTGPDTFTTVIYGMAGNDLIDGRAGADSLYGGTGADTIVGGTGADTLDGGADRDVIFGAGGDEIDGGEDGDDFDTLDLRGAGSLKITFDTDNAENGTVRFRDTGETLRFVNVENVIPCFTPGSLVLTDGGEVLVENLAPGDRVLTRDNGYQEIRWMARRDLTQSDLRTHRAYNPVLIARGSLGDGLPERDLMVSPQHRMLIAGARGELLFGEREVLSAATHLVGMPGVTRIYPVGVSYIHFMFDRHEIVRADGAWSESFQPGSQTVAGLGAEQRQELLALFPDVLTGQSHHAARLSLKSRETAVLVRG